MSIKIKRYHANESDFKMTGRNRTEINVLKDIGFTDLTSSYCVADMHIDVTQGGNTVILPATFGNGQMVGAQSLIKNSRVVCQQFPMLKNERRNQNVISANQDWYLKSRAEEDCLATFGNSTNTNYGYDRLSGLPDSPFVNYSRPVVVDEAVNTSSGLRRAEIQIPLKHVDNFASMAQFPNLIGDMTYNIEFEDQIPVVAPARMPSRAPVPCDNRAAVASKIGLPASPLTLTPNVSTGYWRPPLVGDLVTAYYSDNDGSGGSIWNPVTIQAEVGNLQFPEITSVSISAGKYVIELSAGLPMDGATNNATNIFLFYFSQNEQFEANELAPVCMAEAIVGAVNVGSVGNPLVFAPDTAGGLLTMKTSGVTDNDSAIGTCPWYVGAPVTLLVFDDITDKVTTRSETTITSLTVVAGGDLQVVVADPIAVTVGAPLPCLAFRDSHANTKFAVTWNIDEFYLELFKINLLPSQMASAMKSLENIEIPFIDQLLVQKNMASTLVHSETLSAPANCVGCALLTPDNLTLLSHFDNLSNYRWSLNGKEVTNQPIIVGGSNSGRQIHNIMLKNYFGNLGQALKKYDAPAVCYTNSEDMQHTLLPLVMPTIPAETLVQITLVADETPMTAKNLFFVFSVSKVLKISKGRAEVV